MQCLWSSNTCKADHHLTHLESVTQLALEACICSPPGSWHTCLEGNSQLPLLAAQLSHVIQICA